jgi:hypothetical protein
MTSVPPTRRAEGRDDPGHRGGPSRGSRYGDDLPAGRAIGPRRGVLFRAGSPALSGAAHHSTTSGGDLRA